MITAFELQTFQGGQWKIDSIFDDRESVIFEAKRIAGGGRHTGVRVIQETHDPESNQSKYKIIFKGGEAEKANAKAHRQEKQVRSEAKSAKQEVEKKQRHRAIEDEKRKARAESNRWYVMLAVKGSVLVFLALVLLAALNILSDKL